LFEDKFFKLCDILGLQATAIMGGCPADIISPLESPKPCVVGRVLET
jgi:hypothetical protein